MRFDLRLHGVTGDGKKCQADVSVYANSQSQLLKEAHRAAEHATWRYVGGDEEWVPEGSAITVERVEPLGKGRRNK